MDELDDSSEFEGQVRASSDSEDMVGDGQSGEKSEDLESNEDDERLDAISEEIKDGDSEIAMAIVLTGSVDSPFEKLNSVNDFSASTSSSSTTDFASGLDSEALNRYLTGEKGAFCSRLSPLLRPETASDGSRNQRKDAASPQNKRL